MLFSAEDLIWPDRSLAPLYPLSPHKRFLCSGGIMAQASTLMQLLEWRDIDDAGDDQLYYTKAYIDDAVRTKYGLFLDNRAEFFQNLNGAIEEVSIAYARTINGENRLRNDVYNTEPLIIHGNGPSKLSLNRLANYIPDGWRPDHECPACIAKKDTPSGADKVTIGVFVDGQTPFLSSMLNRLSSLDYDQQYLSIFVYNNHESNEPIIKDWLMRMRYHYHTVKVIGAEDKVKLTDAKKMALNYAIEQEATYVFMVDGVVQFTNGGVLKELMSYKKDFAVPIMTRYGKLWSNFWGSVASDGYYARSDDYIDIVESKRRGVFNIPYANAAYLIHADLARFIIDSIPSGSPWVRGRFDPDLAFAANMRELGVFMFAINENYYGRLIDRDTMPEGKLHPELWLAEANRADWEEHYLQPAYWTQLQAEGQLEEPCPDVMTFQFLTQKG